ncbi:Hypothetical predicted protein [Xyrichtys novacula]|uniref:Uncharacterized protein n=1 Tax=Xyrichtys novacula TaxID=13765 RepID=A0AAV1H940_XYRNO|nr:Hypothetical predicted protein [Xyrichtys novacula]
MSRSTVCDSDLTHVIHFSSFWTPGVLLVIFTLHFPGLRPGGLCEVSGLSLETSRSEDLRTCSQWSKTIRSGLSLVLVSVQSRPPSGNICSCFDIQRRRNNTEPEVMREPDQVDLTQIFGSGPGFHENSTSPNLQRSERNPRGPNHKEPDLILNLTALQAHLKRSGDHPDRQPHRNTIKDERS